MQMSLPRFFIEGLHVGRVDLPVSEAEHARRVRRLSVGEPVVLFDGRGGEGSGSIIRSSPAGVEVVVEKLVRYPRPRPALTLAVALPKGARQDALVSQCTELGAAGLRPISTERSVSQASEHKLEKWRKATIEAAKQSQQAWLPALAGIEKLPELLRNVVSPCPAPPEKSAAVPEGQGEITDVWREPFDRILLAAIALTDQSPTSTCIVDLLAGLKACRNVLAFIGPEGGWTDEETRWILETGAVPVSLGPNILRIETAAIALASFFHGLASNETVEAPLDEVEY